MMTLAKGIKRKRDEEEDPMTLCVKGCLFTGGLYMDVISIIFTYAYQIRFYFGQEPSREIGEISNGWDIWSMTVDGPELFLVDNRDHSISVFGAIHGRFLRKLVTKPMISYPRAVYVTANLLVVEGGAGMTKFVMMKKNFTELVASTDDAEMDHSKKYSVFVTKHNHQLTLLDVNSRLGKTRSYNLMNGRATGPWKSVPRDWATLTWHTSPHSLHRASFHIYPYVIEEENRLCFAPNSFPCVTTASSIDLTGVTVEYLDLPHQQIVHVIVYGSQFILLTKGRDSHDYFILACDRESGHRSCEALKLDGLAMKVAVVESSSSSSSPPIVLVHMWNKPIQVFEFK